jgi:hypothetical protein
VEELCVEELCCGRIVHGRIVCGRIVRGRIVVDPSKPNRLKSGKSNEMTDEDFVALTHFQMTVIHESRGFVENVKRDTAFYYTQESVDRFLEANQLSFVIRGQKSF